MEQNQASTVLINELCMDILPNMTASYILSIFHKLRENPVSVSVRRTKFGPPAVAIVRFPNETYAKATLSRLHGTIFPDTQIPLFRFNLVQGTAEKNYFDVYVGNLTNDVDDIMMFKYFVSLYDTVVYAKIIRDGNGTSKGFGYVKFIKEEQQKQCLKNSGLRVGKNPIIVKAESYNPSSFDNLAVGGSSNQRSTNTAKPATSNSSPNDAKRKKVDPPKKTEKPKFLDVYMQWNEFVVSNEEDDYTPLYPEPDKTLSIPNDVTQLIEYNVTDDVDKINLSFVERDFMLWDAVESSHWLPLPLFKSSLKMTSDNTVETSTTETVAVSK